MVALDDEEGVVTIVPLPPERMGVATAGEAREVRVVMVEEAEANAVRAGCWRGITTGRVVDICNVSKVRL